jgi:hypothetical protein
MRRESSGWYSYIQKNVCRLLIFKSLGQLVNWLTSSTSAKNKKCVGALNTRLTSPVEECVTKINTTMKRILAIVTVVLSILSFAPSASAWDSCNSRVVGYTRCGRPIMAIYQVCGYDRCGNPVGHWVTQSSRCGCNVCSPRPSYHYSPPSCPPRNPYHYGHSSHSRGGFRFSFGR